MADTNGTVTIIPAPDGYVVDFANPQTQFVIKSYTVAAVEMTLAFLFLIQRLYTKVAIMKNFQLEDGKLLLNARWNALHAYAIQASSLLLGYSVWVLKYVCSWDLLMELSGGMPGRSVSSSMDFTRG
jgi:hypothetical protein